MKLLKKIGALFILLLASGLLETAKEPTAKDGGDTGADSPAQFDKTDWKVVAKRTQQSIKDKELSMMASGVAYYATLAFFPAVLGLATIYALIAGPHSVMNAVQSMSTVLPNSLSQLLKDQLSTIGKSSSGTLGTAAVISIVALLWSSSSGAQNLIKATNYAYGVEEDRNFVKLRGISLLLTLGGLVLAVPIIGLLVMKQTALQALGLPQFGAGLFTVLRWPLLVVLASIGLAYIYRYAPNRHEPKWQWVSWGSTAATVVWLIGTAVFFYYTQHFASLGKTYGTFVGIVVLMTWFNLSSLIVLVGAQVNGQLEYRTEEETSS